MKPSEINSRVLEFLHSELLTNSQDIQRLAKFGLILVRSSDFLEDVAFHHGANAVFIVNEFYRNFLGQYDLICVEKAPLAIRFCTQISDGGQDGVQLSFAQHSVRLVRLTANFGLTTFSLMKEYKI